MIPDDSPPSRGLRRAPTRSHATLSEDPFGPSFLTVCDPGKTPRPSRSSPAAEREPGSISCHEFLRGEKRPHHLTLFPTCPSGTRAHCRRGAARRAARASFNARRRFIGCAPLEHPCWSPFFLRSASLRTAYRRRVVQTGEIQFNAVRSGSKPGGLNTAVEHAACRL